MGFEEYFIGPLRANATCLLILTWMAVLPRCWVRIRIVKSFGLDDWLMVIAQVGLLLLAKNACAR
jgi:hypothetical protein